MEDLHYHLEQLEKQVSHVKSTLRQETKRYERLNSQLQLTRHQLSIYTEEAKNLQTQLNKILNQFTKEVSADLRIIKTPITCLLELSDKLLLILDIKDRSWKSFRSMLKNFPAFKNLMISIQNDQLPENVINEVLPLWKSQGTLRLKLSKINNGACVLLDWISMIVEYNLKSEISITSKKRIPELERMIKIQAKILSDLASESLSIEELVNKTKSNLDDGEMDCEDCSELSLTSKPYDFVKSEQDERQIFHSTMHRGTASGGIMQNSFKTYKEKSELRILFPNFNSESLYGEAPVNKNVEVEDPIIYEGKNEMIGCCRMRFFCF
ncbi:hypothetical protein SteCoe_10980 [Stentor coeruleus]|uniref:Dynein heavy chain coiled coil stalk domain-containing protein n=1 Tax=Stentor coeruleus TaxID=5963 RepID=A0A1R2CEB2_9CILI|nr:hypothetical protein SteCoe_10980 [Stentor coeruleus]